MNNEMREAMLIEETYKKSALNAKNSFDFDKLVRENDLLITACYSERLEEVSFEYKIDGLNTISNISEETKEKRYLFLINFIRLKSVFESYKICISADEIYYDENMLPKVKKRDLISMRDSEEFLFYYKAVILGVLLEKSIDDIIKSGIELVKNNKGVQDIIDAKNEDELLKILKSRKEKFLNNEKKTKLLVDKSDYTRCRMLAIITPIMLAFLLVFALYLYLIRVPYLEDTKRSNEAFRSGDYVSVIAEMEKYDIDKIDKNTKYILAYSYTKTETLDKNSIDKITSKMSVESDNRELNFWINLGRLDFDKAKDNARSLSNDQLLMYELIKERDYLENNSEISGSQKASKINEIESEIETLGEKYADESAE